MTKHFDVAIIGSGFAGSILAWILSSRGRSVVLIDPVSHPRFAIGESSTPIADLLLRRIGEAYGLTALEQLSTYGSWQEHHPEIACGRKRGFSYYVHEPNKEFFDTPDHERSLLVAASASDDLADTHWYRRDVDQFMFQQALDSGTESYTGQSVCEIETDSPHRLTLSDGRLVTADWVIDGSGRAGVTADLLKQTDLLSQLSTNTSSAFAHYRGVRSWREVLVESGIDCQQDPFHADDAAQHHLQPGGWIWMLRFNNAITSIGLCRSNRAAKTTAQFPSFNSLLRDAELVEPANGPILIKRLQRLFSPCVTPRCLMLPATACTIDPLHSTGIAHALSGVQRIAEIVLSAAAGDQYGQSVLQEARLLDRLVSTAYQTISDFPRFAAACMMYFAAAINSEERILSGETPTHLWNADDQRFVATVDLSCEQLIAENSTQTAVDHVRRAIEPWNTAGLMDANLHNRYAYTATK